MKERLRKLADVEERKAYRELVKDIMPKPDPEPFLLTKISWALVCIIFFLYFFKVVCSAFCFVFDTQLH